MPKLETWYSKVFSPAGKEVLIKAVAKALHTYMSCFLFPIGLANNITSVLRQFWWSTCKDIYKIPWVPRHK